MLHILIPVYNESAQIQEVLDRLRIVMSRLTEPYEIIVVDDGSTDGSADIVIRNQSGPSPILLRHETNRGVSAAFRTGFDHLFGRAKPQDRILTLEANRNADPEIIPLMMRSMDRGADLVLASCYAPGGRVVGDPMLRLVLSRGVNLLLKLVFPIPGIHTYTSFYRLWNLSLLDAIRRRTGGRYFDNEGFACMADMLLKARRMTEIRIAEVPLVLISDIRETGSKMKIGRTIMGYLTLFRTHLIRRTVE